MRISHISYGFLIGCIVSVAALHWITFPSYAIVILSAAILIALLSAVFHRRSARILLPLAASLLGIVVAMLIVRNALHVTDSTDIEYYADGKTHTIYGKIVDAPDIRPTVTKFTIAADFVTNAEGKRIPVTGRVLVNDGGGWPEYRYGDSVTVNGALQRPAPIDSFAYDKYLAISDIFAIMPRARIEIADDAPREWTIAEHIKGTLFDLRAGFESQINQVFPEPHASLLAGLLTGSRRGIPEHLSTDFRASGVTHIVAISGYNITIIMALFSGLLFWIPYKRRFPVLVAGIVLFTIFVGSSASVVRAAIMGILGLIALQTGRQTNMRLAILWTAFSMIGWNPNYLWYDAGFQLSFLAIIGLTELAEPLKKLLKHVPETLAIKESLIATIAAQIATLPLLIILFHQISLIAPITNLLVAPLVPIAMLIGFIATVVSFVWMPLGLLFGYYGWAVLQAIIFIAEKCAHLPLAVISW